MKIYAKLNVGTKILLGYLIASALMLAIGILALIRLDQLNRTVVRLTSDLASVRQIANDMNDAIALSRLYANQYINTHDARFFEQYTGEVGRLDALITKAEGEITAPEQAGRLNEIKTGYAVYKTSLEQIHQTVEKRDQVQNNVLDVEETTSTNGINAARAEGYRLNNQDIIQSANDLQTSFLLMRLDSSQYFETGNEDYLDQFKLCFSEAQASLDKLEPMLANSDQKIFDPLKQSIFRYANAFQELQVGYHLQDDLVNNNMDVVGPQIGQNALAIATAIGSEYDASAVETNAMVVQTRWILLVTMAAALALGIGLGVFIVREITRPLKKVARIAQQVAEVDLLTLTAEMRALADGDLTRQVTITSGGIEITSRDEIGMLALAINAMVERLREAGEAFRIMTENLQALIGQVFESAHNVSTAAEELATFSGQAGHATNQIAITIQQVARGTSQQAESVSQTALSVEQLGQYIEGIARGAVKQSQAAERAADATQQMNAAIRQVLGNVQMVSHDSALASQSAQDGAATVEETVSGMHTIKTKVDLSAKKVREMGDRSSQIGSIVETIEEIASQTNLLALNAAIEAARAGENGRGFAVVADEVRKLAERASAATKEISALVRGIERTVQEAVKAMGESALEVDLGVEKAQSAGAVLSSILNVAEGVNLQADEASRAAQAMNNSADELVQVIESVKQVVAENNIATGQMKGSAGQVRQAIENIASVSEESSAAVEEVSASTEAMSAQVEETNAAAEVLSDMARDLLQTVSRFKLPDRNQEMEPGGTLAEMPAGEPAQAGYPIEKEGKG